MNTKEFMCDATSSPVSLQYSKIQKIYIFEITVFASKRLLTLNSTFFFFIFPNWLGVKKTFLQILILPFEVNSSISFFMLFFFFSSDSVCVPPPRYQIIVQINKVSLQRFFLNGQRSSWLKDYSNYSLRFKPCERDLMIVGHGQLS